MRKCLIVLLVALSSASVHSQQDKGNTTLVHSIRVEKVKAETKSGKLITDKITPLSIQTYDNAGNVVESIVYEEDGDVYAKYTAKYDDASSKIEDAYFDAKGVVRRKTLYQYDESKKLIGKLYYDSKNSIAGESIIKYKDGRIDELVIYDTKGVVTARTVYTYYDDKRIVESRHYDDEGFRGGRLVTFDERGWVKESNSYELEVSDGTPLRYQHDADGRITEMVFHIGSDTITWRYSYEFDAHGNWVKRIITPTDDSSSEPDPKPIDITKRTISYRAGDNKPKQSTAWRLANYVASDVWDATLRGYELERRVPSSLLSSLHLYGQAKVFVFINELGRVILAVPYGRLSATRVKVSTDNLRKTLEKSAKAWKYTPNVQDGEPTPATGIINFNFALR